MKCTGKALPRQRLRYAERSSKPHFNNNHNNSQFHDKMLHRIVYHRISAMPVYNQMYCMSSHERCLIYWNGPITTWNSPMIHLIESLIILLDIGRWAPLSLLLRHIISCLCVFPVLWLSTLALNSFSCPSLSCPSSCTVSHKSEYYPHIFVNILLNLFIGQHWRNDTLIQCKVVSVQLV